MTKRLQGKVALIFGAGSVGPGWGNGKATAVLFAREGAKVVAVDRNPDAVEETRNIILGEGGECLSCIADVTKNAEVEAVVARAVEQHGRVDILQNNVGITEMGGPVELSPEAWQRTFDVNTTSIFLTCKHVLPVMERQGGGAIVNISSLASIRYTGYPYIAYYAAKGAVNQFTVGLALQYAAKGIRVNAVLPGYMNTPLIHQQISGQYGSSEEMVEQRNMLSSTGKMGTGWDIAQASLFLASDDAAYVNGVCLPVDGGAHCRVG